MKLIETDIIEEGLKFGEKEQAEVMRDSKDVRVGCEYEFNVDDSFAGESVNWDYYQNEWQLGEVYYWEHEYVKPYTEAFFSEFPAKWEKINQDRYFGDPNDIENGVFYIRQIANDETSYSKLSSTAKEDVRSVFNALYYIHSTADDLFGEYFMDNVQTDHLEENLQLIYASAYNGNNKQSWESTKEFRNAFLSISVIYRLIEPSKLPEFGNVSKGQEEFQFEEDHKIDAKITYIGESSVLSSVVKVSKASRRVFDDLVEELEENFPDYDYDDREKALLRYVYNDEAWEDARHEYVSDIDDEVDSDAKATGVREAIFDHATDIDPDMIEGVVTDPSVPDGCELVTKPLSLQDTFDTMTDVFDFIDENGDTASNTGLHVNISIKNLRDINIPKLFILMDDDYITGGGLKKLVNGRPENDRMWPSRNHVSRVLRGDKLGVLLYNCAQYRTFEDIEKTFRTYISTSEKYQGINFKHMINDRSDARIEFRYMGGDGYHTKQDIIQRDILRYVFMMKAASDKDFARKEYQTKLFRFLDKHSKKIFKMPFVQLHKEIDKLDEPSYTEFLDYSKDRKSKQRWSDI